MVAVELYRPDELSLYSNASKQSHEVPAAEGGFTARVEENQEAMSSSDDEIIRIDGSPRN
jgi:hypothetical protein